ncbi:unnamed protein product, partial [Polarella glacialis]
SVPEEGDSAQAVALSETRNLLELARQRCRDLQQVVDRAQAGNTWGPPPAAWLQKAAAAAAAQRAIDAKQGSERWAWGSAPLHGSDPEEGIGRLASASRAVAGRMVSGSQGLYAPPPLANFAARHACPSSFATLKASSVTTTPLTTAPPTPLPPAPRATAPSAANGTPFLVSRSQVQIPTQRHVVRRDLSGTLVYGRSASPAAQIRCSPSVLGGQAAT